MVEAESTPSPSRPWLRPLLLLAALFAIAGALKLAGVDIRPETVTEIVRSSGGWGIVVFVLLVVVTNLAQVPAWVLVLGAGVVWDPITCWATSYVACLISAAITYEVFLRAGGKGLKQVDKPWVKRILDGIHANPVRGVALLRALLMIAPPITVALALTGLRRRDHMLGTALGILIPLTGIVWMMQLGLEGSCGN